MCRGVGGGQVWFPATAKITCAGKVVKTYLTFSDPELPTGIISLAN